MVAQLHVIKSACKETLNSPMCCFRHNADHKIACDVTGPLEHEQFMKQCRKCQTKIKMALGKLSTE